MIKLLIADDELPIRRGIAASVPWADHGVQVVGEAADGLEALRLAVEHRPDVVITDVRMPLMDGLEFAEKLRERFPAVKVLLLSGYADFAYAQQAIRLGVTEYLLKPFGAEELLEKGLAVYAGSSGGTAAEGYSRIVAEAVEYLETHYAQPVSLREVCGHVELSESYLSRLFKQETGENIVSWLNRYRVERAKEHMRRDRGAKIYEIAERSGFREYKYFCKNFKRYAGMSPKKYMMYGAREERDHENLSGGADSRRGGGAGGGTAVERGGAPPVLDQHSGGGNPPV